MRNRVDEPMTILTATLAKQLPGFPDLSCKSWFAFEIFCSMKDHQNQFCKSSDHSLSGALLGLIDCRPPLSGWVSWARRLDCERPMLSESLHDRCSEPLGMGEGASSGSSLASAYSPVTLIMTYTKRPTPHDLTMESVHAPAAPTHMQISLAKIEVKG